MKTCLIPPVTDLDRFVGPEHNYHLALSHLIDHYPSYGNFYSQRSRGSGDYVILDNGAKELGAGSGMETVLQHAIRIGASEVVLSDVRYKAQETINLGRRELNWLTSYDGMCMYDAAKRPRLMLVPQGATPDEWFACMDTLIAMYYDYMAIFKSLPDPVVAVAYHYDHLFPGESPLLQLIDTVPKALEIHLLGWTRRLEGLAEITAAFPQRCRSVDSSRPFVYAMKGLASTSLNAYPNRGDRYFDSSVPSDYDVVARANVNIFKQMAGDR